MTRRTADIFPYDSTNYQPLHNILMVSAAIACHNPCTNSTYILILHECLYYGSKLDHSLLNPNQLRYSGTPVWDNPFDMTHDLSIECDHNVTISLQMEGTKMYFLSRAPTDYELSHCTQIELTSVREWNHLEVRLRIQSTKSLVETSPLTIQRSINSLQPHDNDQCFAYNDISTNECILHDIEPSLVIISELHHDHTFYNDDIPARRTFTSHDRHRSIDAIVLSEMWGIGKKRAEATL